MIIEADRERIFGIMNCYWSGAYSDRFTADDVVSVDCVKYTRPSTPLNTPPALYFHWRVMLGGDESQCVVAVATDEPGEREILHRNTGAPSVPATYEQYQELGLCPPHCDPRVLHAPNTCTVCDEHASGAQALRAMHDVSCTGKTDRRWPCPADVARPNEQNQIWMGNRPW